MIGNIVIVGDANRLNAYLAIRQQFLYSYKLMCAQKGFNYEPHKLKIVVVNDVNPNGDEYIVGSILLPKSQSMFHLIEGNVDMFKQTYWSELDIDKDIQEYLAVIFTGILERNFDFVLYFDNDDPYMWTAIANALAEYLYSRYGVICYDSDKVALDNKITIQSSVIPQAVQNIQSIVDNYGLSNRDGSQLWIQY